MTGNLSSSPGSEKPFLRIFKHVRLKAEPDDGTRLLIMRFWPRGVRKDHVHEWIRGLAPSRALLKWCWSNQGDIDPETFANTWKVRYREEMAGQTDLIENLCERLRSGESVTLLCACHNPEMCHRTVLAEIINMKLISGGGESIGNLRPDKIC